MHRMKPGQNALEDAAAMRRADRELLSLALMHSRNRTLAWLAALERFAAARGHTVAELALAWLAAQPQVSSVIAGATTPEQVAANARALEWRLTADDLAEIDRTLQAPAQAARALVADLDPPTPPP